MLVLYRTIPKRIIDKSFRIPPKAAGKIINKFRELAAKKGRDRRELILNIQEIYNIRKNIDHGLLIIGKEEAENILEKTKKTLREIEELLNKK